MLCFPPPLAPQSFLDRYWQKEALFLPAAIPRIEPFITADELAWLATLEDVESRLITTQERAGGSRYRVQHGPFSERRLARLPANDWTLLVHDVDKHLPEFRRHFAAAAFLPDWRIDDLMISVAAPGGSVGPHRDNYDVFLCQAEGAREWRLAAADDAVPVRRRTALALLEPFEGTSPLIARPSDVLYIPPGMPHWGIAVDRCITCSIGMRAPMRRELAEALVAANDRAGVPLEPGLPQEGPELFYADPDLRTEEAEPGMIAPQALQRARRLVDPQSSVELSLLAQAFGELVTQPKAWLTPEMPDEEDSAAIASQLVHSGDTGVHGMARLGWYMQSAASALVFANGRSRTADPRQLREFRRLCATRVLPEARCGRMLPDEDGAAFVQWLVAAGAFDLGEIDSH